MFGFNRKKIEIQPEDEVTLKPIFGIEPGTYLAVVYVLIILGLLFLLLFYPGLTKPGSQFTINTEPSGAAIRIDDVYQGTSPCRIFIPQGQHRLTAVLPGFTPEEQTVTSGNRVFASLLFPLHTTLSLELKAEDPIQPVLEGVKSYAAWSFAGEPSATYQVPLVLSEAMYRGAYQASKSGHIDELKGLLAAAARFAGTTVALRDLSRTQFFVHSGGLAPSGLATLSSLQDALAYLNENPAASRWLAAALPSASAQLLTNSDWYKKNSAASQNPMANLNGEQVQLGSRINIGPLQFQGIHSGTSTFYMAETEVTQKAWDAFVAEHPEWAKDKKEQLIAQGLVGPDYLETPQDRAYPSGAVPGISYYAAKAFCAWLDTKVPQSLRSAKGVRFQIRLPTEKEWYLASSNFGNKVFANILGGLWEWCSTPYVHIPELSAPEKYINLIGSSEFVVKGGSWANKTQTIQPETRASLPPDSSSPFVGFRPVFAIEDSHE